MRNQTLEDGNLLSDTGMIIRFMSGGTSFLAGYVITLWWRQLTTSHEPSSGAPGRGDVVDTGNGECDLISILAATRLTSSLKVKKLRRTLSKDSKPDHVSDSLRCMKHGAVINEPPLKMVWQSKNRPHM